MGPLTSALRDWPGHKCDHVQSVPKWLLDSTFAQVTALSPEICKTVGYCRTLLHTPALPQRWANRAVIFSPRADRALPGSCRRPLTLTPPQIQRPRMALQEGPSLRYPDPEALQVRPLCQARL